MFCNSSTSLHSPETSYHYLFYLYCVLFSFNKHFQRVGLLIAVKLHFGEIRLKFLIFVFNTIQCQLLGVINY